MVNGAKFPIFALPRMEKYIEGLKISNFQLFGIKVTNEIVLKNDCIIKVNIFLVGLWKYIIFIFYSSILLTKIVVEFLKLAIKLFFAISFYTIFNSKLQKKFF